MSGMQATAMRYIESLPEDKLARVIEFLRDLEISQEEEPDYSLNIGFMPKPPLPDSFFDPLPEKELGLWEAEIVKRPFSELFGSWHGQIWMSDDFDEPLDEMKEYMQ